jgi:type VI secretion system protein ImpJ
MHHENRVIWGEGMFLRPQHFQQADRWTERMLYLTLQMTGGYFWGRKYRMSYGRPHA